MSSGSLAKSGDKKSRPRRGEVSKYKYRVTDPFIFTYGCDLHHRPYTTPKLKDRKKSGKISIQGAIVIEKIMLDPCMCHTNCPKDGKSFGPRKW